MRILLSAVVLTYAGVSALLVGTPSSAERYRGGGFAPSMFDCLDSCMNGQTACPSAFSCVYGLGTCSMRVAAYSAKCVAGTTFNHCQTKANQDPCSTYYSDPCGPDDVDCDTEISTCGTKTWCDTTAPPG